MGRKYIIGLFKIVFPFVFGILCTTMLKANQTKPLIWNMTELEQMRNDYPKNIKAQSIIKDAEHFCQSSPIVIIKDRVLSIEPNEHFFCSMGPYIWPDTNNPGKYISIDGKTNPDSRYYDSGKLSQMAIRCEKLSKAYYITHERKYYKAFILQLKAWFINKGTYMLPNFEYAQIRADQNYFKGTSTGMIDAYPFNTIIESIRLVEGEKKINRGTLKRLKKWFFDFAEWAEDRYGIFFREKGNQNISVAYDVTIVNMYLFAGNSTKCKDIVDGFAERRILKQIKEDGSQPEELKRPIAFAYSLYNLTHFLDFCYLVRTWDEEYYVKHGARIDKAFLYLQHYASLSYFPYQKISDWDKVRSDLYEQVKRIDFLKHNLSQK